MDDQLLADYPELRDLIAAKASCDCKGTGIMGGPGGYYDTPSRGKPCHCQ